MIDVLIQVFSTIPPVFASALLASLPITELRGALPIALVVYQLDPMTAYVSTVLGNLIPLFFVFTFLPSLMRFLFRYAPRWNARIENHFAKLQKKHGKAYSTWGAFFLFLFVAIPLPGTGVWTGSVLAVLFKIKRSLAIPFIVLGLLLAGIIVLALTQGIFHGIKLL